MCFTLMGILTAFLLATPFHPMSPEDGTIHYCEDLRDAVRSMDRQGDFLYVVTYSHTSESLFRVYDISNPPGLKVVSPRYIRGIPIAEGEGNGGKGVVVRGNYAYIVAASDAPCEAFRIVDVADPANPVVVGGESLAVFPSGIGAALDVADNYAYLIGTFGHFVVIDISNPYDPEIVSITQIPQGYWTVKHQCHPADGREYVYTGGRPWTENRHDAFRIIDVTDKNNPTIVGGDSVALEGIWSLEVNGNYAYIAAGGSFMPSNEEKFFILDISDSRHPAISAGMHLGESVANYVKRHERHVLVTTWGYPDVYNLYIIDLNDPRKPALCGKALLPDAPLALVFYKDYIFAGHAPIQRKQPYLSVFGWDAVMGAPNAQR